MRGNITLATGVVVLLIGTLMMASIAEAKPYKRSGSGWQVATEIDTNADGERATSTTGATRGTFGKAIGNSQSEFAPGPSGICDGNPGILKFDFAAWTAVTRFHKGDLLAWGLDHGTACLDTTNPPWVFFTSEVHAVILRGTGRFEGATGSAIITSEGFALAGELGVRLTHTAIWGTTEGEIFLAP